jgi:mRNA-degrading endonuclease toxin of MazEF toxin-antitoxin module
VSFDPTIGAEIKKTRSAIILQNDVANRASPVTIVAATTSQFEEPIYPTEMLLKAPGQDSPWTRSPCLTKFKSSTGAGWFGVWV